MSQITCDTEEDARFYLEAAFEEDLGDGRLIGAALSDIARGRQYESNWRARSG